MDLLNEITIQNANTVFISTKCPAHYALHVPLWYLKAWCWNYLGNIRLLSWNRRNQISLPIKFLLNMVDNRRIWIWFKHTLFPVSSSGKIRTIYHARDLWKLTRSCKPLHLPCPPDREIYQGWGGVVWCGVVWCGVGWGWRGGVCVCVCVWGGGGGGGGGGVETTEYDST